MTVNEKDKLIDQVNRVGAELNRLRRIIEQTDSIGNDGTSEEWKVYYCGVTQEDLGCPGS